MLEGDLLRYFGVDLPEAIWGEHPISARRLRVLIRGLPLESNTLRAEGAPKPGDWTNADELLASLLELEHASAVLYMKTHSKRGAVMPRPLTIRRPGAFARKTKPQGTTIGELRELVGAGSIHYTPKD